MATTKIAIAPMKAAQIPKGGADFQIVEREIPAPGVGEVRIKVQACGICHSDVLTKDGLWPGIQYPRVPGHEVAGILDELGAGVSGWTRSEEHTSELQSRLHLVCRLLLEKKKNMKQVYSSYTTNPETVT